MGFINNISSKWQIACLSVIFIAVSFMIMNLVGAYTDWFLISLGILLATGLFLRSKPKYKVIGWSLLWTCLFYLALFVLVFVLITSSGGIC